MNNVNVNNAFYGYLSVIAQHFNQVLFDDALPMPFLSLKRGQGALGYYSRNRWQQDDGQLIDEISLDPTVFAQHSWLTLMQTIAHQQCHLWQHCHGTPSRAGYHNAEWAEQMEAIGLIPSATGQPGGRKTGQRMLDYPEPCGPFIKACIDLSEDRFNLPLVKRFSDEAQTIELPVDLQIPNDILQRLCSTVGVHTQDREIEQLEDLRLLKRKVGYSCPQCSATVWGRQGLELQCQTCNQPLWENLPTSREHRRLTAAHR